MSTRISDGTSSVSGVVGVDPGDGTPQLAWGTAKRTYRIEGGRLALTAPEPLRHDLRDENRDPKWPPGSDYWPFKAASDVVVLGKAFGPSGRAVEQRRVSIRVGNWRKRVQVFGKRFVEWSSDGKPRIGAPEPFTELDLVYTNAYGGLDPRVPVPRPKTFWDVLRLRGDHPGVYPRNQSGKGYLVVDAPVHGVELPNLEDPDRLLTPENLIVGDPSLWYRQPLSWFLDWQFPAMFPRAYYVGARPWQGLPSSVVLEEVTRGFIPEQFRDIAGDIRRAKAISPVFFQEASLGMSFSDLREGTAIELEGMHPERERLELLLPAFPRLEIDVDGDRQPVAAKILHVVLTPHEEKVEITWAGIREALPRAFFPGIHGHIPITLFVDGTPIPYETPEPIYPKIKQAEAEGKLRASPPRRRPGEGAHVEIGTEALSDGPPQRERDQVSHADALGIDAIDAAAGRVLLDESDWLLSGAISFALRRSYSSSMAWRPSALGFGWSCSLEQAVWIEGGWVLYRAADGREIGIPAGGELGIGRAVHHPTAGVTIRRVATDAFEVRLATGERSGFTVIDESVRSGPPRARLTRIWSASGGVATLRYDVHGRIERLELPSGRGARFEHDSRGMLTRIFAPTRDGSDWVVVARYDVDAAGLLREFADALNRTTTYRYQGRLLTQEKRPNGLVRRFVYDGAGARARCIAEQCGEGREREVFFGAEDRVIGISDARGGSFSFRINDAFLPTRVLDHFANETTRTYDETTGLLACQVTPDGETTYLYDAAYHLADVSAPDRGTVALEHDDAGHLTKHVDADGRAARWAWDHLGRLSATVDRNGVSTLYEFDGEGPLASVSAPGDVRLSLTRDPRTLDVVRVDSPMGSRHARSDVLSRIGEVADELGHRYAFRYDPCGRVAEIELPTGLVRAFDSDAEGRVTSVRDGVDALAIERDGLGRVLAIEEGGVALRLHRDPEGDVTMIESEALDLWEVTRDAAGRVIEESGFDGTTRSILRDHGGRVQREVRGTSRTEVRRDRAGRPVELEHSDVTFQRFAWTPAGHLARAQEADRIVDLTHDGEGRITLERVQDGHWVKSDYDANGRRVLLQSSLGLAVRVERDGVGNAIAIMAQRGEAQLALRFDRDACGRESSRVMAGGLALRWQRDELGRPVQRTVSFGESALATLRFHWAGVDRLVGVQDTERGTRIHRHDARGRLVQAGAAIRALDDVSNVFRTPSCDDHRYAPGGRLLEAYGIEYRYDAEGRRVEKVMPDGSAHRYRWDPLGRLIEVALSDSRRVVYDYDALGRRVARRVEQKNVIDGLDEPVWELERETRYLWDGLELLHEVDGNRVASWIWEGGALVGKLEESGAFAVFTDPLGMPMELADVNGNIAWRGSIDVFGTFQRERENIMCPWRFAGHHEDPDTGLAHAWLRVYDPETGAYITPNPLGIVAGTNLYSYLPDPLSQASPLGLGRGYEMLRGATACERLAGELIERFIDALDRRDGAAGPRACFDLDAATPTLPDPEAYLWGAWERHRPSRRVPPATSSFTRLPQSCGLSRR